MTSDKNNNKQETFLREIEDTNKSWKHFIEVEYPSLSFEDKVKYWYSSINSDIRDVVDGNIYGCFSQEEYRGWKQQEPEIDKILGEVMKSAYVLGINKRRFYFSIGKYWRAIFP